MKASRKVCGPMGLVIPARRFTRRTIRAAPCRSSSQLVAYGQVGTQIATSDAVRAAAYLELDPRLALAPPSWDVSAQSDGPDVIGIQVDASQPGDAIAVSNAVSQNLISYATYEEIESLRASPIPTAQSQSENCPHFL